MIRVFTLTLAIIGAIWFAGPITPAFAVDCNVAVPPIECTTAGGRITQIRPDCGTSGESQLNCTLNRLWGSAARIVGLLLGMLAVFSIILAGYKYITSVGGSPDNVKKARQQLINVILGVALLGSTYFVLNLIYRALTSVGS